MDSKPRVFSLLQCLAVSASAAIVAGSGSGSATPQVRIEPSHESAHTNAYRIFNAIHSATRQWGSSLNHNGFGFLPAIVSEGTVLYHGSRYSDPPAWPEWLAFEVEHAEAFAQSTSARFPRRPPGPPPSDPPPEHSTGEASWSQAQDAQAPLKRHGRNDDGQEVRSRGYFHTYRATRDLNLLYIDGTSAGKSDMGMMDSQDLLLLGNKSVHHVFDDMTRAAHLCDLITDWGYDGVMRMEIGFEVIFCDFSNGLHLMSTARTYYANDTLHDGDPGIGMYQWARASGERYDGLGPSRVRLDFSSMVSGFFFPINISSTDSDRPDLIRLAAASLDDLKDIKDYLQAVSTAPRKFNVQWQSIVDMIISRFAERLVLLGWTGLPNQNFIAELQKATMTYIDAPPLPDDGKPWPTDKINRTADAIDRCIENYLVPALPTQPDWSKEDQLIYTALDTVLGNICRTLFAARSLLFEASPDVPNQDYRIKVSEDSPALNEAISIGRGLIHRLLEHLAWTEWKKPRRCPLGEIAFVAMWPFGSSEDHWNPGCRSIGHMSHTRSEYWGLRTPSH
ncbi:hypothetical protein S7711_02475 [Stachybotrys chartarum IBT 7711]|uniref:Uncharacterized protein n=1 Tax=Stachybotrys chartarum (strain CBS 109288 / IBT 7711) TaxID=1280523 RepID=A0A084B556_STACB|nr:hypothetical protein S7711_02475 [Stachybotrys chartarum IBT 7711]